MRTAARIVSGSQDSAEHIWEDRIGTDRYSRGPYWPALQRGGDFSLPKVASVNGTTSAGISVTFWHQSNNKNSANLNLNLHWRCTASFPQAHNFPLAFIVRCGERAGCCVNPRFLAQEFFFEEQCQAPSFAANRICWRGHSGLTQAARVSSLANIICARRFGPLGWSLSSDSVPFLAPAALGHCATQRRRRLRRLP